MQITAFKAILARIINIQGCEDYENTFARMESDCTLRFGFKVLIKSISYTKQSNLFLHAALQSLADETIVFAVSASCCTTSTLNKWPLRVVD